MDRYYFDHNATTPLAAEVLEAMMPALTDCFGNSSSIHRTGQEARQLLDHARRDVAAYFGRLPEEVIFTSGGTEADNLGVLGMAHGGHVVTTTFEHPAVLEAAKQIADVTFVAPDRNGLIDPLDIQRAIRTNTRLVSVMHANNELGTIQPIEEIGRIAREQGIAFHSDGIQAVGKVPVNYCPDLYAISAHKFYGPKGSGALIVRKGMEIEARQFGGRHQRRIRPGTENVAGAVGLAAALKYCQPTGDASLRDLLETLVLRDIADAHVNGVNAPRVPNTSNLRFDGIDSEPLLIALDMRGFAISAGSACSSGAAEPSHVLTAIGLSKEQARSSIRISLGKSNTREQVEALAGALAECVAHLRKVAPAYV